MFCLKPSEELEISYRKGLSLLTKGKLLSLVITGLTYQLAPVGWCMYVIQVKNRTFNLEGNSTLQWSIFTF